MVSSVDFSETSVGRVDGLILSTCDVDSSAELSGVCSAGDDDVSAEEAASRATFSADSELSAAVPTSPDWSFGGLFSDWAAVCCDC